MTNQYRELQILDAFPTDPTNFEASFQINSDNGYVSIGHNGGDYPIHIKGSSSPRLRLEDTTNSVKVDLYPTNSNAFLGTNSDSPLWLRINNGGGLQNGYGAVKVGSSSETYKVSILSSLGCSGAAGICGDLDVGGSVVSSGQIYSNIVNSTINTNFTPNFSHGNVYSSTVNSSSCIVASPAFVRAGAMYVIIFKQTGSNNVPMSWNGAYIFANGIKPNIIRGNSNLVVSLICESTGSTPVLYCTWAEDFS